jgi:hypothetical protein
MAATRWSAAAMAELRSLEATVPRTLAARIRPMAQEIATAAGRSEVERLDVCEALGRLYGGPEPTQDDEARQEA